jgi:hypothetical protein
MTAAIDQLSTGWDPDVPVGDTMVRRYLFHFASLCDAFATAAGGRTVESAALRASDLGHPGGYWNAATLLQPPTDWQATLDEVEAFFPRDGRGDAVERVADPGDRPNPDHARPLGHRCLQRPQPTRCRATRLRPRPALHALGPRPRARPDMTP